MFALLSVGYVQSVAFTDDFHTQDAVCWSFFVGVAFMCWIVHARKIAHVLTIYTWIVCMRTHKRKKNHLIYLMGRAWKNMFNARLSVLIIGPIYFQECL